MTGQTVDEGGWCQQARKHLTLEETGKDSLALSAISDKADKCYLDIISVPLSGKVKVQASTTYSAVYVGLRVCLPLSVCVLATDTLCVKSCHTSRQLLAGLLQQRGNGPCSNSNTVLQFTFKACISVGK